MEKTNKHLKAILHSKRANIFYLEKCKVVLNGGRVEYITQEKNRQAYYNIPIANTSYLLLGIGTSITQAAIRALSSAGIVVGFCGNQGTPLIGAPEIDWLTPSNEYRPTEYMQKWHSFWVKESKRLEIAKKTQIDRVDFLVNIWEKDQLLIENDFNINDLRLFLKKSKTEINKCGDISNLLLVEARKNKKLYSYCAKKTIYNNFVRDHQSDDIVNRFLSHGNYLAYGMASTALWVLGISYSFPLMHGKTRRGGLVFDIADLVKDAIVLPYAFILAQQNVSSRKYREIIIETFFEYELLNYLFDYIKNICNKYGV
jgi:CRISPR-associated protein Cas1